MLGGAALVVMLAAAFRPGHGTAVVLSLLGLIATLAVIPIAATSTTHRIGELFVIDSYALFYVALIVVAALVVTVFSHGYLGRFHLKPEEYYILLLLATLGACVLVASAHFATFFLGL